MSNLSTQMLRLTQSLARNFEARMDKFCAECIIKSQLNIPYHINLYKHVTLTCLEPKDYILRFTLSGDGTDVTFALQKEHFVRKKVRPIIKVCVFSMALYMQSSILSHCKAVRSIDFMYQEDFIECKT